MKHELDKSLCDRYPKIFRDRHADTRTTAMCWGFECGDGWYTLINALCNHLQGMTNNNPHAPDRFPQVIAVQVKEKFGGLCFYTEGTSEYQDGVIAFAESMSYRICDVCGNPGKPNTSGWIVTRCKDHEKL